MKKLLFLFAAVPLLFAGACSDSYDDSALTDRVEDLENRVARLEELCRQMNANIASLQTISEALQANDYISSIMPLVENGETIGYTITFTQSGTITIYHGKDGEPGAQGDPGDKGDTGDTPQIGVQYDTDGVLYWTLNGDWLLDANGQKIRVTGEKGDQGEGGKPGEEGVTPRFKIEDGSWWISYDNTATWTKLGQATGVAGEKGDSFFSKVDLSDPNYVVFVLADGTEFKFNIGLVRPTGIVVLTDRVALGVGTRGRFEFRVNPSNATVDFTIEGDDANLQLDLIGLRTRTTAASYVTSPSNYKLVSVEPSMNDEGEIKAGQYTVTIEDAGQSTEYAENVVLVLTTEDDKGNTMQFSSSLIEISYGLGTELFRVEIDGIEAVRTDANVFYVKLPYGTDVKALKAVYTTDGSAVVLKESNADAATIDLSNPVSLLVVGAGGATAEYTVVAHYSDLPVVFINTPSPIVSKTEWTKKCGIEIWNAGNQNGSYADAQMKGRGNTTWNYAKKPYAIKLDKRAKVLGMPEHKRWVLLANWLDITCLRNDVAFEIARRLSGLAWTPHGQFVDVVMNGELIGNYYLCEQIKVDENRVNITEIGPADIDGEAVTGGYIFELDTYYDELFKFRTPYRNLPVQFKDPDEDIADEQMAYVQGYFGKVEEILYGSNAADEDVFDYIDMDSFIDWWFVYELARNGEPGHPKSSYMHKDRNGKLFAGPVWDFDYGTFKPTTATFIIKSAIWYTPLFKHAAFVARVKERWRMHKSLLEQIPAYIDDMAARVQESAEANHQMWPNSSHDSVNGDTNLSFVEAITRMKEAYQSRLKTLDAGIEAL